MLEFLSQPWPWYVGGPIIGLTVPTLLIMGNKSFGISSSLRHVCAACMPANIPFFKYDWKKEIWNMFFVLGIVFGGAIAAHYLQDPHPLKLHPNLVNDLKQFNIHADQGGLFPTELFNWPALLTLRGFIFTIIGGLFVGFGTRYAGGCTSGHAIMGLSTLQWPSLVATCCFMIGGFIMANLGVPFLLSL